MAEEVEPAAGFGFWLLPSWVHKHAKSQVWSSFSFHCNCIELWGVWGGGGRGHHIQYILFLFLLCKGICSLSLNSSSLATSEKLDKSSFWVANKAGCREKLSVSFFFSPHSYTTHGKPGEEFGWQPKTSKCRCLHGVWVSCDYSQWGLKKGAQRRHMVPTEPDHTGIPNHLGHV